MFHKVKSTKIETKILKSEAFYKNPNSLSAQSGNDWELSYLSYDKDYPGDMTLENFVKGLVEVEKIDGKWVEVK